MNQITGILVTIALPNLALQNIGFLKMPIQAAQKVLFLKTTEKINILYR